MDQRAVSDLVHVQLANYRYQSPLDTIGVPWSAEKVYAHIEKMKAALVEPYLQRFELRETYEQAAQPAPIYAEYWVVAETAGYLQWYDPATGDFGLAQRFDGSAVPVSIGVRGDLVGVFCAM